MKGANINVNKEVKKDKLEFNTYCTFTEENKNIDQMIGLIFRDYIEKLKDDKK